MSSLAGGIPALARGLSNDAIGKELWVAEQTVKFHLTNIYRKLGVSNRTEATRYAYENGLVDHSLRDHESAAHRQGRAGLRTHVEGAVRRQVSGRSEPSQRRALCDRRKLPA